jgi:hypothetical protein
MVNRILKISGKTSDLFSASLIEDGNEVGTYDGYVPKFFPNPKEEHYGDYIQLDIDLETGQILNWKRPTKADLKETFKVQS